jgi:nucleoside-diphosphate kinase
LVKIIYFDVTISLSSKKMSADADQGYAFVCEWFDNQSQNLKKFALTYYPANNTVELWDIKAHRMFLKRCPMDDGGIRMSDLFIGSTVTVFQRQLNIIAYGNPFTKNVLGTAQQRTLAVILPHAMQDAGKVLDVALAEGFSLGHFRVVSLNQRQALALARESKEGASDDLISALSSGPAIAMELIARESVAAFKNLVSMRAWVGGVRCSNTPAEADRELSFFFGQGGAALSTRPQLRDTTLCIVKPHTLREGSAGRVIRAIQDSGYVITCAQMYHFDRPAADEFLEVYQGILPSIEFQAILNEMTSGRMIALELAATPQAAQHPHTGDMRSSVVAFRELVGPYPVHIAKELYPNSIRAQFGETVGRNAVHCTDMEEDGILECEYLFSILR